ncbi:hypothetical protein BDQ12DRAFT_695253 [Crucibulum laeve]|uniref:Cupredoxin n=1 Tax=Crucibulum laeve TaxID=68775 RepID=A0A5C3MJQ4_9AGAR|nr:hypothetical protein BDQ12DRAFT_695253 [Crucibulum laeve]
MRSFALLALSALAASVSAKRIVVTVGGNTTDNPGAVFDPQQLTATQGDVLVFNFTQGNHTATQSTFASPCTAAHFTNETINGFDSGFRNAGNKSAITTLEVPITDNTTTIWFFDWNTCAQGGVGGVNINDSTLETLDGITRNAIRLNGTDSDSSSSSSVSGSSSATHSSTSTSATSTPSSNDATRALIYGGSAVIPLILAALSL